MHRLRRCKRLFWGRQVCHYDEPSKCNAGRRHNNSADTLTHRMSRSSSNSLETPWKTGRLAASWNQLQKTCTDYTQHLRKRPISFTSVHILASSSMSCAYRVDRRASSIQKELKWGQSDFCFEQDDRRCKYRACYWAGKRGYANLGFEELLRKCLTS